MFRMIWRLAKAYAMYRIGKAAMRENTTTPAGAARGQAKTRTRAAR